MRAISEATPVGARWLDRPDLPPDAFAFVMATGILAVAAEAHGYHAISLGLGALAGGAFAVLLGWLAARLARRPRRVARTGRQPDRALRAFTFVASATVLGAAASGHHVSPRLVDVLDGLAAAGWLVLVPLAAVDLHRRRMDVLRDHAHGAWLVAAVATAGLAIAAADLAARGGGPGMLLAATALWLLALVLYLAIGALIAWRILARPLRPPMVTPDSWILMGALAITALAGDHLIAAGAGADWARWVVAVAGLLASALIPPLLFAELWRTDRVPGPLEYHTVWWAAVFPLGTYSAAADATARVLALPGLATVSLVFLWDAAAVWVLVAAGLAQRSLRAR